MKLLLDTHVLIAVFRWVRLRPRRQPLGRDPFPGNERHPLRLACEGAGAPYRSHALENRYIYLTIQPSSLSTQAQTLLADKANNLYLSIASLWEMQIKLQIGKLNLQLPLPQIIADQQRVNDLQLLSLTPAHIYNLGQLPFHHKDPFDRMLLSQAMTEGFSLLSNDTKFAAYGLNVIW